MNIVLDTNCLIMSIAPKSPYRNIWNAFLRGDYNLCVSNEIIEEYSEVLARNLSPQISEAIIYAILTRPNVIRQNPHFKVLETIPFPKVEVVGIDAFKSYLAQWLKS